MEPTALVVKTVYLKGIVILCLAATTVHTTSDSWGSWIRGYEDAAFWGVMSCGMKEIYWSFERIRCLHCRLKKVSWMWKKRDMEVGRRMASIGVLSKPIGVRSQVKKSPCLSQFVQGSCPDWPFPSICITFFLYLVYSFTEPQKLPDLRSHSILECNIHMYIGVCVFVHVCGL